VPVPIGPLVAEVAAAAAPAALARGLRIEIVATDDASPVVDGDAFLLHRAVANLLDNALDFSPPGGAVRIEVVTKARSCDIVVRDAGPGIPEYAEGKVFEKFYSLPRPATKKKSTGLGLSFVKEIAELHRGRVALKNSPEGGAVAALSLPLGAKA
jgi:two-component system sensor histidine kinase CreC